MTSPSREIKKALKAAFPTVKFSVRTNRSGEVIVEWKNGIVEGATREAVEKIACQWDTSENIENNPYADPIWVGRSIYCYREITDLEYKNFVIESILRIWDKDVYYYCEDSNCFRDRQNNDHLVPYLTETLNNYLMNGVKTDLNDHEAICDRDRYYHDTDLKKIDKLLAQEQEYLAKLTVEHDYEKYVGKETDTIKVECVEVVLKRPDYIIYNREIVYDTYSEQPEKIKPFCQLERDLEFTILNKESGEKTKVGRDDILNIFDPITPLGIAEVQIRFVSKYAWNRKINDFKYYYSTIANGEDCLITEVIKLSPQHYERFTRQLLNDYEWLDGKGGGDTDLDFGGRNYSQLSESEQEIFENNCYYCCVLVFAEEKEAILVNPEGHNYARYVARLNAVTAKKAISEFDRLNREQKYLTQYKNWVSELLEPNHDRLGEVIDYSTWKEKLLPAILQEQYKNFVRECLGSNRLTEIVDYQSWSVL